MMDSFFTQIKKAIDYALSDRKAIVLIGTLVFINSIIGKLDDSFPLWKLILKISVFFVVGYGSFISWYSLKGSDKHPDIANYKKMLWEGFKKSTITSIYSVGLVFIFVFAKRNIAEGNIMFALIGIVLFVAVYLTMIAGLMNRYLNRGKYLKAFDIHEIIKLMSLFDVKSFLKVILAVIISQTFMILVIVGFSDGFTLADFIYSIAAFFLAPFTYFATKRLVGLNVYDLLNKSGLKRK